MGDRQIRDELVTLILASYETTAFLLACTVHMASTRPAVLEKIREEARLLADGFNPASFSVRSLPYMHRVVREVLRVYPPVPVIGREALAEVRLRGVDIEPGAQVIMSAWAIHRSGRYFPQPHEFIPERWDGAIENDLPRYGFFPFGGGPRVCIGQHMAVPEVMLIASLLLSRATLSEVPGCRPTLDPQLTMTFKRGTMRMKVDAILR